MPPNDAEMVDIKRAVRAAMGLPQKGPISADNQAEFNQKVHEHVQRRRPKHANEVRALISNCC
jgi:hypothetical protein